MPNLHRGEIEAHFDGRPHTLCLTLGALAELEAAFGDSDMLALAERFQAGRLSARDASRILGAGLRGAGHVISDDDVGRLKTENGAAGFVAIVAKLLAATFGGPVGASLTDVVAKPASDIFGGSDQDVEPTRRATADPTAVPFPGPR